MLSRDGSGSSAALVPAPGTTPSVLIADVLHDLGHGAATVSYLAEALAVSPHTPDDLRERLAVLRHEADRVRELVDRADGGTCTTAITVREVVASAAAARAGAGGSVVLHPGEDVVLVTDPLAVWRVVTNLLDNAVRAAGPAGRVEVTLARRRARVVLEVTDDGPGRGLAGAAGRGLGIVVRLCGSRAGVLQVRRLHPHGTRVRVTLPGTVRRATPGGRRRVG